jgi:hypothetical protein
VGRLARQLEKQLRRPEQGGRHPALLDPEERAEYVRNNVLSCADELHEALNEVGWKPWATSRHMHRDQYLNELADAQLFLDNLVLGALREGDDIDALEAEFAGMVAAKVDRHRRRVEGGYDGVSSKCACGREVEDGTLIASPQRILGRRRRRVQVWQCPCGRRNTVTVPDDEAV